MKVQRQNIDRASLEAVIQRRLDYCTPHLKERTAEGASARLAAALTAPFLRWLCDEIEMCQTTDEIAHIYDAGTEQIGSIAAVISTTLVVEDHPPLEILEGLLTDATNIATEKILNPGDYGEVIAKSAGSA